MPPVIRLATPHDAAQVQAVYAAYFDTPITFEVEPPPVEEMAQRITKILAKFPWLVCEHDGEILGYAYGATHKERAAYRWCVDVGVYIRQHRRRRGIGRALYTSLLDMLRLQRLVNAYAGVTLPNPGSVGLHESMGFEPVGVYQQIGFKCGAWHDVAWFQRPLQPRPSPPAEPLTLDDVRDSADWQAAVHAGQALIAN
jgi:phosphinothricin acetyltransferase